MNALRSDAHELPCGCVVEIEAVAWDNDGFPIEEITWERECPEVKGLPYYHEGRMEHLEEGRA